MLFSLCRWTTVWCWLPILLAAQEPAPGTTPAAADAAEKCVFAGTVHDSVSGQPLAHATVNVISRVGNKPSYVTDTDAQGAFRFEAIGVGDYAIQVSARGYRNASAVSLKPGQATSWLHFTKGQSITGAAAALDPPAVISGRVTDQDGEPIAHGRVEALARQWWRGFATLLPQSSEETDDHGEYHLSVQPGRVYLRAYPRQDGALPEVFSDGPGRPAIVVASVVYPNVPDMNGATEFDLHAGQQLGGIDFKLPAVPAYRVRGSVQSTAPWDVVLQREGWPGWGGLRGGVGKGAFHFSGVPAGRYWLKVYTRGTGQILGRMPVQVTDRDVDGGVLNILPPATLKGHVRFDWGDAPVPARASDPVQLYLYPLDILFSGTSTTAGLKDDNSFEFDHVAAGEAVLELAENRDFYMESMTYNQRDVPNGKLDLSGGAAGELEVVLAAGTGQIGGTIHWPDALPGAPPSAPADNIQAVLVRADGVTGNTGARVMGIDQEGHFQFSHLGPGRYYVWAVTHFDDQWQNMDFVTPLESRGVVVDLPAKGSVQIEIQEVLW